MRIGKIQNNQISYISIMQDTKIDSVVISVCENECWINGKLLKENMYLSLDDMVFFLDLPVHHFSGFAFQDEISIGRENCDINIDSNYISYKQAVIREGRIYDLGSRNGIYVNHQRVSEITLQVGDIVDCIFLHMVVVQNGYLVQSTALVDVSLKSLPLSTLLAIPAIIEEDSQLILEPDFPNSIPSFQGGSLWLSVLPSLSMSSTILVSNFLSNHSIAMNQWILYIGMFISMGIIPLIQRVSEKNRRKKQEKRNHAAYLEYLQDMKSKIQNEIVKEERIERESFKKLHIGLENHPAHIEFHIPKVNYEMKQNELYQQMLKIVNEKYILKDVPQTIDLNEITEISLTGKYLQEYFVYLFDYLIRQNIKVTIAGEFPVQLSYLRFLHSLYFNQSQTDSLIIVFNHHSAKSGRKIYYDSVQHGKVYTIDDHSFFPEITEEHFLADNHPFFNEKLIKSSRLEKGLMSYVYPSNDHRHLIVPIGIDEAGNVVELDLHEKGQGPHGLIAGMTGSGKSEFLITLILSLAYTYSPEIVTFMLIDYKGGGLSDAFSREGYRLPHLRSTLTNLEGENIERVIYALRKEVVDREKLFSETKFKLNLSKLDIDEYIDLYKANRVETGLAHLVIIVDEFAELKVQYESLIQEMIHISRVGRSLGLHLILATQKPSGVVNQQIWSNASFHICLKVQDASDSLEMLHQKDGAYLENPGEFYMQIGLGSQLIYGRSFYVQKKIPEKISISILNQKDNQISECDAILVSLQKYEMSKPLWLDFEKAEYSDLSDSNERISVGLIDDYKQVSVKSLDFSIGENLLVISQDDQDVVQLLNIVKQSDSNISVKEISEDFDVKSHKKIVFLELNSTIDYSLEKKLESYLNDSAITVICYVSSISMMKYSLQKYFTYKLVFGLNSQDEYRLLFGNGKLKVPKRQGWGLIYLDDLYQFKLFYTRG